MAKVLFHDHKLANILFTDELPSGGAAVQTYGWIHGLLANGHQVSLITDLDEEEKMDIKSEFSDLEIIPSFDYSKGVKWLRWVTHRYPDTYRKIKKINPDYVYESIPNWGSYFLGKICRSLGTKYVLRISNDSFLDDRILKNYTKFDRYFLMKGIEMADIILVQNDYQLAAIKKYFPKKNIKKISNPIYVHEPEKIIMGAEKDYIAWAGLFQYQKNLKLLYQIASALPKEKFKIAGTLSSKEDEETYEYLGKLEKLPNVEFVGFLERRQVLAFFANAKYLLNTSRYEGFSNTFLEAMMMGTPILTSEHVNPDFLISGNNLGIVYRSSEDLSTKLVKVDKPAYEQMVSRVLDYVAKNHNYKLVAANLMRLLEGKETLEAESSRAQVDEVVLS
ncbi:glycosyltransferase family 4 protein [Litoribacter alkaliphilus]|uniref:Glycosyltransferase family 4 protein n=1 Tax=Litoribacter ruber TaxID=702568 RepID=A0AAP2CGL8_9BACT|nr:glycosyltransferase family 4 protein [Litoribacter alkaliphilus]MBS9524268.1 glycosyltransferase family 4 protein [Litoribacter alkaliphilus]